MAASHRHPLPAAPRSLDDEPAESGRWIGWAIYGTIVLVGFVCGVVAGNARPKTIVKEVAAETRGEPKLPDKKSPEKKEPEKKEPASAEPEKKELLAVKPPEPMMPAVRPEPKPEPPKPEPKPEIKPKTEPKPQPKPEPKKPPEAKAPEVSFVKEVLPVFKSKCNLCHGDTKGIKGDLDLRSLVSIKKGGASGDALVPGDLMKSAIWERIKDGADEPMPPPGKAELTPKEKLLIKNWILSGGK